MRLRKGFSYHLTGGLVASAVACCTIGRGRWKGRRTDGGFGSGALLADGEGRHRHRRAHCTTGIGKSRTHRARLRKQVRRNPRKSSSAKCHPAHVRRNGRDTADNLASVPPFFPPPFGRISGVLWACRPATPHPANPQNM